MIDGEETFIRVINRSPFNNSVISQWKCHRVIGAFYIQRLSARGVGYSADIHGEVHCCWRWTITIWRIKLLHSQVFTYRVNNSGVTQLDSVLMKWWENYISQITTIKTVDNYLSFGKFESLIQMAGQTRIAVEDKVQWHNPLRKLHYQLLLDNLHHCNTGHKRSLRLTKSQLNSSPREKILPDWVVWHVLQYFLQQSCGTIVKFVRNQ